VSYLIFETGNEPRNKILNQILWGSPDSVEGIVTWVGAAQPRKRGSNISEGGRDISKGPDQHWGPTNLLLDW
jgi:hypothetical protein